MFPSTLYLLPYISARCLRGWPLPRGHDHVTASQYVIGWILEGKWPHTNIQNKINLFRLGIVHITGN